MPELGRLGAARRLPIAAVYSSPLERAVETAGPIAKMLGLETELTNDLLEINFGEWTNCTFDDLRQQPQFQRFNTFRSCTRIPGGETMPEAQVRIVAGLEKLYLRHPDQTVVAVSHADLIKAAIAFYAGIHLDLFHRIEISPASVSTVEMGEDYVRILGVNDRGVLSW